MKSSLISIILSKQYLNFSRICDIPSGTAFEYSTVTLK